MSSPKLPTQPNPTGQGKELPNEIRMVLAFVLMGLILVATPWVYRKLGIAPAESASAVKSSVQTHAPAAKTETGKSSAPAPEPAASTDNSAQTAATTEAAAQSQWTIDTKLYRVVFSNRGASVQSWTLKNVKDDDGKPLELVNKKGDATVLTTSATAGSGSLTIAVASASGITPGRFVSGAGIAPGATVTAVNDANLTLSTPTTAALSSTPVNFTVGFPFTFEFRGQQPTTDLNTALWVAHPNGDGTAIEYDFSDGRTTAKKTFAFQQDGYMVQYADEVKLGQSGLPHLVEWRGGFGDFAANSANTHQQTVYFDADKRKLVTEAAKSAKNGPQRADGNYSFAGIQDQYFTAAFLPPPNTPLQTTTFDDLVPSPYDNSDQPYPGVAVGGEWRNQLGLYVGPKEVNALRKVNPKLEDLIDWGFFGVIAKPLFLALQWMTAAFVHNYGWAIVLLTIAINVVMFPLRLANLKSMRKMQALQPELSKINDKYKGISMSDPRAAQKQQETMDLYKKHGVNPMGGCVPMLIQLPFLWAFYKVLSVTFELRDASWLWVPDLSQPEHTAIRLLPIVMIATSFLMQKMTPMAAGVDPNQQKIMQFMPLMWGFFFWSASSGLVLYWLTSNLAQIGQQWFFNKTVGSAPAIATTQQKKAISTKAIPTRDGRKRT